MFDENRNSVRRALYWQAVLLCEGKKLLPCTLVDVSETGARLTVRDTSAVPDHFTLILAFRGTARRRCRLVWRGSTDIGVVFEVAAPRRFPPKLADRVLASGSSLDDAVNAFAPRS